MPIDGKPGATPPGDPPDSKIFRGLYAIDFHAASFSHGAVVAGSAHADVVARSVALLQRIETLPRYVPRRPQVLPQLMRTVNDPNASGKMMADIIGKDPVLAGNLLRIASSPLYCVQSKPVEDFTHAVAMVGTDGIRLLIAAALMWEYTLVSPAAATDHAKLDERDDPFAAQLMGLLQGLGSIIVGRVVRDQYASHLGLVPDADVITALLEAWAVPAALRVAGKWQLPERIHTSMERTQAGSAPDPLGRSLRYGQLVAALALLCKHGRMEDMDALALIERLEARPHATADIWTRVRRSVHSRA